MRRPLALVLSLVGMTAGGSATAQTTAGLEQIALPSDKPLAFILFNPSGDAGRTRSSALIQIVSDLVEKHTDFKLKLYDADEANGCAGRLDCIVRTVRRDYQRKSYVLANGTLAPFSEHQKKVESQRIAAPEYLLVISNITGQDADRMSITIVDTNTALEIHHTAPHDEPKWERGVESQIIERALLSRPRRGKVTEEFEARRLFEDYFLTDIRRRFDEDGHWEPYGRVQIETPVVGAGIALDGVTVGTTRAGVTTLTNVTDGQHDLALLHPEYEPWSSPITARRRDTVVIRPQLEERASGAASAMRQTVFWGGIGAAAAGAVFTTIALASQDGDVTTYCLDGTDCAGTSFTSFGFRPEAAPSFGDDVNPSGVLVAPLGYSLVLTGATWTLTTLLFGEDDDFPWWQLVAGVIVGGASYGLSSVLDGGR